MKISEEFFTRNIFEAFSVHQDSNFITEEEHFVNPVKNRKSVLYDQSFFQVKNSNKLIFTQDYANYFFTR